MNTSFLLGRMTKEPDFRVTQSGKSIVKFNLAVQRKYKNPTTGKYDTDFFNCQAWGKLGEAINSYCSKGQRILIEGELQNRSWTTQQGEKRMTTEINVVHAEFIEKREGGYSEQQQQQEFASGNMEGFGKAVAFDEEIPF